MPVYTITHATSYRYAQRVDLSYQALHLEPLATETQECLHFDLEVRPMPLERVVRLDYFGNRTHYLAMTEPHQELHITARSQVAVTSPSVITAEVSCDETRTWLATSLEHAAHQARQFLYDSPGAPRVRLAVELAQRILAGSRPVLQGVWELSGEIHRRFVFDTSATHVATPLEDFVQMQRGVCQDFAHFAVATLRAAGLSARYVSGYLLTNPPPGQFRQLGTDASHAWVSVYVPGGGWVDFDPTNNNFCDDRYITTARGRDYGDVSPVRGTVMGGGPQALFLGVTVTPAGEAPA